MTTEANFTPIWEDTICSCCKKRLDPFAQRYKGNLWGHTSGGSFFSSYLITACQDCNDRLEDEGYRKEVWERLNKETV